MPIQPYMRDNLKTKSKGTSKVKRGMEIFEGSSMSPLMEDFVGQYTAIEQIEMAMMSAKKRDARLAHTLLGSGIPGIGKTSLAKLIAYNFEVGLVECSGKVKIDDLVSLVSTMEDKDILFVDEAHSLGTNCDAFLTLMTEGYLLTKSGPVEVADITVILATTDYGRLPEAMLSRCLLKPQLTYYNDEEQVQIVEALADRLCVSIPDEDLFPVARAANGNPRAMQAILSSLRDMADCGEYNLRKAFRFAGVTEDGLDQIAQDILVALLSISSRTASIATLGAMLAESGNMAYSEKVLLSRNYIEITGRGRRLTDGGEDRARQLL